MIEKLHVAPVGFPACLILISMITLVEPAHASETLQNDSTTHTYHFHAGWNLLSLPVGVSGGTKETVFPSAISNAFIFDSSYKVVNTLENGIGFWIKFETPETLLLSGTTLHRDTINIHAGWNILGLFSTTVTVDSIQSEPAGIVSSPWFGYSPDLGYEPVDSLRPGSGYWVKAIESGTIILNVTGFSCPTTVEYSGKIYNTVEIGKQCWMMENLDVGMMITGVLDQTDNDTLEKYCYDNQPSNCMTYGALYQWDEAMQYSVTPGTQGICPPGWHIPTEDELRDLDDAVGGDGNALKALGQGRDQGTGTNTSGFSALLAGERAVTGGFFAIDGGYRSETHFWSSSPYLADPENLTLWNDAAGIGYESGNPALGFSVRCTRD